MHAKERVILSLDPNIGRAVWVADQVKDLVSSVQLCLLGRASYQGILDLKYKGFKVCVDLRCMAEPDLLKSEYKYLKHLDVDMVAIMVHCGAASMGSLQGLFPKTEIAAVLSIDSITEDEYQFLYQMSSDEIVVRLAQLVKGIGITSLVCSPREFRVLKSHDELLPLSFYVRNVVPANTNNKDDQNVITVEEAITGGAAKLIVGNPVNDADDPRFKMQAIIDEVAAHQEKRKKRVVGRTTRTIDPGLVKRAEAKTP